MNIAVASSIKEFPKQIENVCSIWEWTKITLIFYMHALYTPNYIQHTHILECRWHLLNCK